MREEDVKVYHGPKKRTLAEQQDLDRMSAEIRGMAIELAQKRDEQ